MCRILPILEVLGLISQAFGVILFLPTLYAFLLNDPRSGGHFAATALLAIGLGYVMMPRGRKTTVDDLQRIEGMGVVAFGWLYVALLGAVPYLAAGFGGIDSLFESMSGFTTTGATIFSDFAVIPPALFFFRGLTQWLGGMGILVLFVAILPHLAVSGRQLFFAETSAATREKLTPRIRDTAQRLWGWYMLLSLAQIALLYWYGMPLHDSICNTFATMAAGGFSPHGQSIMGYQNPAAEWIIILFMFIAGANFTLQVKALRGNWRALWLDFELRGYTVIVLLTSVLLLAVLVVNGSHSLSLDTFRACLFQNLSILTTTGFASEDFNLWKDSAKMVLVMMMFIGGCSGSAGGGIKVIRFLFMVKFMVRGILKSIYPKAISPIRLGPRLFHETETNPIVSFVVAYFLLFASGAAAMAILENDLIVGATGAIVTLGNIGPGFGAIGPMGSFAGLHPLSKIICTVLMWAGRLEVMTLILFCHPKIWQNLRWNETPTGSDPL
jgi:trk system potassium uptake protein TrkH